MSSTIQNKISSQIQTQFPEFIQSDHSTFIQFLKYYYQFLESGKLVISGANSYVLFETQTKNYLLDETTEKIVLEESEVKFIIGETIVGQTSKATAKVLVDDFDNNSCLFITSQQLFIPGEEIVGQSSGAKTIVVSYQANPVQNIQQFLDYVDVDYTVTKFLDQFRDAYMDSLPSTLASGLSKRKLIKNIKDLYAAKGTEDGHKLFFRILFDEEATIIYPKDNILRASDGVWSSDKIMRVIENGNSDFNNLIGETIYTLDASENIVSSAIVITVVKFREGNNLVAELSLDPDSINGTFNVNDIVYGIDNTLDIQISATVQSIVADSNVTQSGFYYEQDDKVFFEATGNNAVLAKIDSIGSGSIDEIMIESGGSGYAIGEYLSFNNTNTEGKDALAKIVVVGGSITLEENTDPFHLITEDEEYIISEDNLYLELERNLDNDDFLTLENEEDTIILENDTLPVNERGEITKIKIIDVGSGYIKLPKVSVTTVGGSNASLFAVSTETPGVGHAQGIAVTNFGLQYTSAPATSLSRNLIVKNVTGSFSAGDILTSHSGSVIDYDSDLRLLRLNTSVNFKKGDTILGIAGSAEVHFSGTGTAETQVGTIGTTVGNFVNERGKVSNDNMKLQDSYYYQDFSYVVRIGQSINEWRSSLRKAVHPAGWNIFGEVSFSTLLRATPRVIEFFTNDETGSQIPVLNYDVFYTKLFGRRLGTTTDTSPSTNPSNAKLSLASGERDVTLRNQTIVRLDTNRGSFSKGMPLANLPKYAFAIPVITSSTVIPNYPDPAGTRVTTSTNLTRDLYTIQQFSNYTIDSVSSYFYVRLDEGLGGNGDKVILEDGDGFLQTEELGIPESAYTTRINVPPPSEIIVTTLP